MYPKFGLRSDLMGRKRLAIFFLFLGCLSLLMAKENMGASEKKETALQQQQILTAVQLVGNALLDKPLVLHVKRLDKGRTIIEMSRLVSKPMTNPPVTQSILSIEFEKTKIILEPVSALAFNAQRSKSVSHLSQVAVMALSSLFKQGVLCDNFELEVAKRAGSFLVHFSPIPFTPDADTFVSISSKDDKLEINKTITLP